MDTNNKPKFNFPKVYLGETNKFIELVCRAWVRSYRNVRDPKTAAAPQSFITDRDFMSTASWSPAFNQDFTSLYSLASPKITWSWGRELELESQARVT